MGTISNDKKATEIGLISHDWNVVKLEEIGEPIIGLTYTPADVADFGTLVLRSSNIQNYRLSFKDNVFVKGKVPDRVVVKENDLLICVRNGSKALIGKCALIDKAAAGSAFGAFMSVFRSKLSPLLLYQFQSGIIQRQINEVMGATINQLTNKDLRSFMVALPPTVNEQETITNALSDADAYIESLEKLIAKKRLIKKGVMQELLTGKRRLPGFRDDWKQVSMRDILVQSASYGIVTAGRFVQDGIPMLRSGEIRDGSICGVIPMVTKDKSDEYSRTILRESDVVIALVGYPGSTSKIPNHLIGGNISRAVGLLRFNPRAHPDFMVHYLNSPAGRSMVLAPSAGSAQQVVNLSALNKLEFSLPAVDEQSAIAVFMNEMDNDLFALEQKLLKVKCLKQGMMQELLTGRIRLV